MIPPCDAGGPDFRFPAVLRRGLGFVRALSLVLRLAFDLALTVVFAFARFVLDLDTAFLRAFLAISASQAQPHRGATKLYSWKSNYASSNSRAAAVRVAGIAPDRKPLRPPASPRGSAAAMPARGPGATC